MRAVSTREAPTGGVLGLGPLMMMFIKAEAQRGSRPSLTSDIGELYRYAEFVDETIRRTVDGGRRAQLADEALRVASEKYPGKTFRTETGADGITRSSGSVAPETLPFWDELHIARRAVELDIESFHVFAKILLDRWAVFVARYFGAQPGFKHGAHGWLTAGRLAQYAAAKGLTPVPPRLEQLVESLQRRVIGYRNDGIVHGKATNVYRSFSATGLDGVSACIIGVQLPGAPEDAPGPVDSGVPGWLLVEINEYLTAWFIYISENAAKCCVPIGSW
jgi:hypothetical protein